MAIKQAYFAGIGPFTYDDSAVPYGGVFDKVSIGETIMSGGSSTNDFSIVADNKALVLGADGDAKIYYDGTDLVIKPNVVGAGEAKIDGNINATGVIKVDGDQLLTVRQAAITDPSGGGTIDAEARTALIAVLDVLRTHGLIAI